MILVFLVSGCLIFSSLLFFFKTPQWGVIYLVLQALFMVIFSSYYKSIWFSYILILVFLGGLMVMFIYISSLTSNLKMDYFKGSFLVILTFTIMSLMIFLKESYYLFNEVHYEEVNFNYIMSNFISLWGVFLYLFIVVYLLLTLYCVCWLIKVEEGPLRLLT